MRRPLRFLKNQLVNAILMVALTVPLVLAAVSLADPGKPTLSFEGTRIQVAQDGSIQLLFDVCIRNVAQTDGTQFTLHYNSNYIEPSDYETNEVLLKVPQGYAPSDGAFKPASGLYYGDADGDGISGDESPFGMTKNLLEHAVVKSAGIKAYSSISMYLFIDRTLEVDPDHNTLMTTVTAGERNATGTTGAAEKINVLDGGDKLVLGTISFRVNDPDMVPAMMEKFNGLVDVLLEDNHAKNDTADKLLYFEKRATGWGTNPWGLGIVAQGDSDVYHDIINDFDNDRNAQAAFTYNFPKTIIKARAAEAELTINAYQAYTDGTVSDIDEALQRYSPAITVTYSDGSEGNFVMPWGRTTSNVDGLPWTDTVVRDWAAENWTTENWKDSLGSKRVVVDNVTDNATQIKYDPTASRYKPENQRYLVQKDFCYVENGENKTFPIPIDVKLTVTPITLVDVTATDLHHSYLLNDALVDPVTGIQDVGDLDLPTQARLTTDVPAGGVTLTMDIPGWSHPQTYDDGTTSYWPSDNTTPGSGTGTTMLTLWRDGTSEAGSAYLHWPTTDDTGKWETIENGSYLGTNRAGVYTFDMAESYGGVPTYFTRPAIQAAYPWLTVPDNNEVKDHPEAWPIENATRTIVWNGEPKDPDKPDQPELLDTNNYQVSYVSTVDASNGQPELTLQVRKVEPGISESIISLPKDSVFRIKLPDGTEMAVGYWDDEVDQGGDWFDGTDGSYHTEETMLGNQNDRRAFNLVSNPGDPTQNSYGNERERLRRYINLGGWFSVAVKELDKDAGVETLWSNFIPVYVPPRDNYYTESKVYNFIGNNAGLYPWPGGLSTTVILPPGTYNPVEIQGSAIVPVYDPAGSSTRKVERYGVSTTYDGATGAQPGELNTFTIDPTPAPAPSNNWQTSTSVVDGKTITTYGAEYFMDGALYSAYGKVLNWVTDRGMEPVGYDPGKAHTATVRVEELDLVQQREAIILEYVETHGGEQSVDYDGAGVGYNVSNVIFETRTEGYTVRQDYVLRIRNVGDVDISGLSIDTLNDLTGNPVYDKGLDSAPAGGHFELLKPPASFLPAGESTTFVLTYVYDLRANPSTPMEYRDKLFITSNRHHTLPAGPTTDPSDYLLDFDAQFQVTSSDIHRVFVRYIPTDGCMGTANVIIGLTDTSDFSTMNTSAGPTAYPQGVPVYILVSPTDEYTMVSVVAEDSTGKNVPIGPYDQGSSPNATGKLPDGRLVYAFTMPDYDTTVTVVFNEPVSSKLRLSDLRVYADQEHRPTETPENLYPHNEAWDTVGDPKYKSNYQQQIWQKSYTADELTAANTYTQGDDKNLYLMTKGSAAKPNFDSQVDQYLVVLPFDADWAQVEVDLRKVEYIINDALHNHYNNALTGILVQMTLYDTDDVALMATQNADIYPTSYQGNPYAGYHLGETNGPTTHTSIPFLSPDPGDSKYVRVQLSYTESSTTTTRAYYIELHRAPRTVDATLNYGNSPYGMIMNDPAIVAPDAAKRAFVDNNYTFRGMAPALIPSVVTKNDLLDLHYWLEAWAPPTETWTSPNADWTTANAVYDAETGMSEALYNRVHRSDVNLDLNEYSFFALMGEAFLDPGIARATDSSGRPVDLSKATLSLTAYTLDNLSTVDKDSPNGQLLRFALPADADQLKTRTVTFGFTDANDGTAAVSGDMVTTDWAEWYLTPEGELTKSEQGNTLVELRPGRYELVYSFPDYNHIPADPVNNVAGEEHYLTVKRDFVVLAPVGDVNADRLVTTSNDGSGSDEHLVEGRISPDAGYPALGYMAIANVDGYTDYTSIFKLRTCDVNNDRNINNIDANAIHQESGVKQFYLPVDYKPTIGTP